MLKHSFTVWPKLTETTTKGRKEEGKERKEEKLRPAIHMYLNSEMEFNKDLKNGQPEGLEWGHERKTIG